MYIDKTIKRMFVTFLAISILTMSFSTLLWYKTENLNNGKTIDEVIEKTNVAKKEIDPKEIVLTIDDVEISYEKFSYYLNKEKNSIDGGNDDYWTNTTSEISNINSNTISIEEAIENNTKLTKSDLEERVLNRLCNIVALQKLQEEYYVVVSPEDVENEYNEVVTQYGQDVIDKLITDNNLTIDLYKDMLQTSLAEEKLFDKMFSKDILSNTTSNEFAGYKRLLITFKDDIENKSLNDVAIENPSNISSLDEIVESSKTNNLKKDELYDSEYEEEITTVNKEISSVGTIRKLTSTEAKTLIDNIYKDLQNGASFDEILNQYGEDSAFINNEISYVKNTELLEPENSNLFSLKENEFSKPFISQDGYEILMRLPVSEEYIHENIMYFTNDETWTKYSKVLSDKTSSLKTSKGNNYIEAFINAFE